MLNHLPPPGKGTTKALVITGRNEREIGLFHDFTKGVK